MSRYRLLRSLAAMLVLLCTATAGARADIFMFTDGHGTPHFSDAPTDPRYRLYLHVEQDDVNVYAAQSAPPANSKNRERFSAEIKRAASLYRLDEHLLHAVISAESGYNPHIVSSKGAMGLMQLMPETAKRYKVTNSFDPTQNIDAGAQYLSKLLGQFDNNIQLALAAYNAGENNVRKYGGRIPPYPETLAYVPKVMSLYLNNRQTIR